MARTWTGRASGRHVVRLVVALPLLAVMAMAIQGVAGPPPLADDVQQTEIITAEPVGTLETTSEGSAARDDLGMNEESHTGGGPSGFDPSMPCTTGSDSSHGVSLGYFSSRGDPLC